MPLATVTDVPLLSLVEQKLARTLVDLPVATDIPRMVSKIKVVRMPHNSVLFERSNKRDQIPPNAELIRELLRSLSSVLSLDDLNSRIELTFVLGVRSLLFGQVFRYLSEPNAHRK
jgi:hypothetical protein